MEEIKKNTVLFNDALLLSVLTSVAYLIAYAYESSYLNYFGIPQDFVSIDIKTIITAGVLVFSFFVLMFQLLDTIATIIQIKFPDGNLSKLFDRFGILFIPSLLLILISDVPILHKFYLIFVPFPLFWFQIIYPLFKIKTYGSYKNAQLAIMTNVTNDHRGILAKYSIEGLYKYIVIILISIFSIYTAIVFGSLSASNKENFFVDNNDMVLIKVYEEKAILAEINNSILTGKLTIKNINELNLSKKKYENLSQDKPDSSDLFSSIKSYLLDKK